MIGSINWKKSGYQFFVMICFSVIVSVSQFIAQGTPIMQTFPGLIIMSVAGMVAMLIKDIFPKSIFPAFGFATIIGLLLTMPYNPMSVYVTEYIGNVGFMSITTPILAFAGISVGNKIVELKKMSWRIVLISLLVFTTIFFACATIAHIVLSIQGVI